MALPYEIQRAVDNDEPISIDGVTLYPITMADWDEFSVAKAAIECAQQTLPVRFAAMPLLSAYYAMDIAAMKESGEPLGLFQRAVLFLSLALRLGGGEIQIIVDPEDPGVFRALRITVDGEMKYDVTPKHFNRWRPILAAQNGLSLPDESANAELLQAQADKALLNAPPLKVNKQDLMAAMAHSEHMDESEFASWTIRKFEARQRAANRAYQFLVAAVTIAAGGKYKTGNPYPDWRYDKESDDTPLTPLSEFMAGPGSAASASQS